MTTEPDLTRPATRPRNRGKRTAGTAPQQRARTLKPMNKHTRTLITFAGGITINSAP